MSASLPPFPDPAHKIALVVSCRDEGGEATERPEPRIGRDNLTDSGVQADGLGGLEGARPCKDVTKPVGEPGRPALIGLGLERIEAGRLADPDRRVASPQGAHGHLQAPGLFHDAEAGLPPPPPPPY